MNPRGKWPLAPFSLAASSREVIQGQVQNPGPLGRCRRLDSRLSKNSGWSNRISHRTWSLEGVALGASPFWLSLAHNRDDAVDFISYLMMGRSLSDSHKVW